MNDNYSLDPSGKVIHAEALFRSVTIVREITDEVFGTRNRRRFTAVEGQTPELKKEETTRLGRDKKLPADYAGIVDR